MSHYVFFIWSRNKFVFALRGCKIIQKLHSDSAFFVFLYKTYIRWNLYLRIQTD